MSGDKKPDNPQRREPKLESLLPPYFERLIRLEKNFEEERHFWRERLVWVSITVALAAIIVGLIIALVLK